jgi:hypothetical protein
MDEFSKKIDRLNDTIILSTRVDSFNENRREIESDLKEMYKEKNSLIEKLNKAKLDVQRERNEPEKVILQEMVDFYKEQLVVLEDSQKEKKAELDKLKQKINMIENKIFTVAEKTPKRSGNSSKSGTTHRVAPPSSILVSTKDQQVNGEKNYETPTISSTQLPGYVEECNRKRKRMEEEQKEKKISEESIDLLGQETETEDDDDDDDDDDDELFKKIF